MKVEPKPGQKLNWKVMYQDNTYNIKVKFLNTTLDNNKKYYLIQIMEPYFGYIIGEVIHALPESLYELKYKSWNEPLKE